LVSETNAGWLVANSICILKKNTYTTLVMTKTIIVMGSPRQLWSKPTWCCIWKN